MPSDGFVKCFFLSLSTPMNKNPLDDRGAVASIDIMIKHPE